MRPLVPQREESRSSIVGQEVGMREIESPIDDTDTDSGTGDIVFHRSPASSISSAPATSVNSVRRIEVERRFQGRDPLILAYCEQLTPRNAAAYDVLKTRNDADRLGHGGTALNSR